MRKYIIAAILSIGFGIFFYVNTFDLPKAGYQLPRILVGVIILLAILMVGESYLQKKKANTTEKEATESEATMPIDYKRVVIFGVMIAAYIMTIQKLGYFIVTPLFVILTFLYLKSTNIRNMLLISMGFTVFVYLLFVKFLHLPVPMGLFE